jgi:alpha-galactosidase
MAKITFIGAGSLQFTRRLTRDIFTFPLLKNSTICLMDINAERLKFAKDSVERIIAMGNYPARVEATMDRAEALKNADAVLCTILSGDTSVWRHDIEIPKKYGIDFNVGDTRGIAGIFRALRTIPVMLDIMKDVEHYCPNTIFLNYTNPMAMLCRAMQSQSQVQITGLCHSVQGTAWMLSQWINAPSDEISYTCAGINHQAWYLTYEWNGKDAYPLIRKAVTERPEIYNEEIVRNEMFLHLDYYVTESSGHNSEYNWWFRKRRDLIEKYCIHGTGWNPGEHAYILKEYMKGEATWKKEVEEWFAAEKPMGLAREHEYAAYIINAWMGGDIFQFNGNVPNRGLITNLPENVCVEVPVFVDKAGFHPVHVGALPPQLTALNHINVMVEEMTVQASLTGNPRLVFQAAAYAPLCASVLSLAEIKTLVREMLEQNKDYLPQFKHYTI